MRLLLQHRGPQPSTPTPPPQQLRAEPPACRQAACAPPTAGSAAAIAVTSVQLGCFSSAGTSTSSAGTSNSSSHSPAGRIPAAAHEPSLPAAPTTAAHLQALRRGLGLCQPPLQVQDGVGGLAPLGIEGLALALQLLRAGDTGQQAAAEGECSGHAAAKATTTCGPHHAQQQQPSRPAPLAPHLRQPGIALGQDVLLLLQPRLRQRRPAGRRLRLMQPRIQRRMALGQCHILVSSRRQPRLQLRNLRLLLLHSEAAGCRPAGQ